MILKAQLLITNQGQERAIFKGGQIIKANYQRPYPSILLLMVSIFLAAIFAVRQLPEKAWLLGLISLVILIWLYIENSRLNDIKLIYENSILTVPLALMYVDGGKSP